MQEFRSLEQLRAVDERSRLFGPFGLGAALSDDDTVQFAQAVLAQGCSLKAPVGDGTRRAHERLCGAFLLGALSYEQYTLVEERAPVVLELALRERFMQWSGGSVTLQTQPGTARRYQVASYEQVQQTIARLRAAARSATTRRQGRGRVRTPRVLLHVDEATMVPFGGGLADLRGWARAAGLLRGQRSRSREQSLVKLRNEVCHPNSSALFTPVDAAHTLRLVTEFVNQLWGSPTPGGQMFPAPLQRTIVAISWNDTGTVRQEPAGNLLADSADDGHEHVMVRSVWSDPVTGGPDDRWWSDFRARWETTTYPADYLWGPGSRSSAAAWLQGFAALHATTGEVVDDAVEVMDRVFLIVVQHGIVRAPRRPQVAAGLTARLPKTPATAAAAEAEGEECAGVWHTVCADTPADAFGHVRARTEHRNGGGHAACGECRVCPARQLGEGTLSQALAAAEQVMGTLTPADPPPVAVPYLRHWPASALPAPPW